MDAPMKVRSDFVTFARAESMALSTARLEKLSTSLRVTLYYTSCMMRTDSQELGSFILLTWSVRHCG
jgi:hypothetical protein